MDILVNVANQKLKIAANLKSLVKGTQEFIRFVYNLTGDWDGLTVFAQFIQNGVAYNQLLDSENSAYLPAEIGAGTVTMMLYGSGGNTIATTNYLTLTVDDNIFVQDAQSTEITQSLYQQLVNTVATYTTSTDRLQAQIDLKATITALAAETTRATNKETELSNAIAEKADQTDVEDLQTRMTSLENNSVIAAAIQAAVEQEMLNYLNNGELANLTIEDGSISRSKVDANFETTLAKADTAMQPSVYDPLGYGDREVPVDPYSFAQAQDTNVKSQIKTTETFAVTDNLVSNVTSNYTGMENALSGVLNRAERYASALLGDYSPFTILIVDTLPDAGAERTFYLVPKESGNGYEKFWYITDENNVPRWDKFGTSSTIVVDTLPSVGDSDVDYILANNGDYQYYKYIGTTWALIAGSNSIIIDYNHALDYKGDGNPTEGGAPVTLATEGKYYLDVSTLQVYQASLPSGASEVTWTYLESLVTSPTDTKDYFVRDTGTVYYHFRYKTNRFYMVGSDAYSKLETDALIQDVESDINTVQGNVNTIDAKVDALGNMVSDITETTDGIRVHYKDSSHKDVATKDTVVKVEDLDAMAANAGVLVTYTDGSTKEIEIAGGGGGGATSGSASITRVTDASIQCVYGDDCNIQYTFSATDSAGDVVGSGTATWYVNNVKKATSTALQAVTNTFNIGSYLNVGGNTIRLSISVDTGGESPTVTTKTWTVNAVNLYLTWDYDDTTLNSADTVTLRWTPYGDLSKVTHILIDGVEDTDLQTTTTRSGVQQYVTMDKLSHGSHMIEMYLTATVNNQTITSASVVHDMIFVTSGNTAPVISCSVNQDTMVQYNTLRIPIVVYNPSSMTSTVVLKEDGVTVATWTEVDRSIHYWNYTPSTYGSKVLTITCGSTTKTLNITVTQLDIDNEEVSGYAFRMKASDIAGNSALQSWASNGVTATFSNNFDWNNGGIKTETDSSGSIRQYICIKAGTTMTIEYELFGNDAKVNGKNFKVIFKTANCRDYDATWLNCMSDGIGIQLGANSGTAKSEQNTISVNYAEGSYVEFEYDIYPDNLSSTAGNPMRYIQTYIDGVLASNNIYASNDNFTQTTKQKIVIGSADCDIYIYLVKCYETYITRENHITNFIADAPNAIEMVARYNRNDILAQNGEIDYQKLATQNPNCRVHLWDIPRMTQNKMKKDPVSGCSYQQIYMAGDEGDQISAENVTIGVQGTSSVNYISSAANTDGNFTEGFTDGNGNHLDGYSMSENSIPVNYFNTKVNVASCENINNMCIASWYNDHQPYKSGAIANVENARDCMEHHIGVQFIRDRHEDNEPASAALFTDIDPDGNNYHMYAICNMGNSKDNGAVFHDANNPLECCIETKDNNSAICMMTTQLSLEDLDSEDYFEFRYPKSPTSAMKTAFINLVNWFASRNPAAATGNALGASVTYDAYTFKGTSSWDQNEQNEVLAGLTISDYAGTYTHDTYEYRMARLLSECEDHLVMDSIVYHYVFVEQHAMVDNVCKNTFWGTDDLVHWHLCKNYDNDTADGNNNTGKLTIPFGAEGMDTISGGDVFNGKMNVYWQLVYGLYPARRLMWQNREAVGTWNADAYLEFATGWQNYIPERVYNQDYWYKYLRPYEQNADTTYISMLEGGKKTHQREGFVRNNLTYMASQYTGTYCTSDSITVRAYTPGVSADMDEDEAEIIRTTIAAVPPNPVVRVMLYNKGYVVVEVASVMKRVKAEKGVWYTIDFSESSSSMNDTVVNIHGASNVRAIGDMSSLYIKFCNFAKASKLRSLQIGSTVTGYKNLGLTSVGFESNPMLEELYIQNCPNSASTLDLSGCQSLRTLDIRGSGFTGVNFAVGGLIENAYLCSPSSLTMRSLYYLSDSTLSLESYTNITTLRLEDTPNVNSLNLVNACTSLSRARILGIDWELSTTDLLNRMLTLMGLDESDHNTDMSVLSGDVYISGSIRNQELANYANAWSSLNVTYNGSNLITQYQVTYVNADGNNTVLYTTYVDQGASAPDPVTLGLIQTPTLESTAQYDYTFSGWDDLSSSIIGNKTITATYSRSVRTYTVNWYARAGLLIKTATGIEYGTDVNFADGGYENPTWTDGEGSNIYHLFTGWDKSTGCVKGNMDVYATWETSSAFPAVGTDMKDMTVAEIYGIGKAGMQSTFFEDCDYVDITLGHDLNFSNVDADEIGTDVTLTGVQRDTFVSGGYYFDGSHAFTTDISLFDEDSPAFTMAIDFQFNSTETGATLVSNHEGNTAEGFRLYYNGSQPTLQWGDQSITVGNGKHRDIVVIRHPANSRYLYVYTPVVTTSGGNNTASRFGEEVIKNVLLRTNSTQTSEPLTFGAIHYPTGFRNYGTGTIHWCKIWYDDLGDTNAFALASFPREVVRMEYWGAGKYYYANTSNVCGLSFIANNQLGNVKGRGFYHHSTNTNVGGWDASELRDFMNGRLFDAYPTVWQSAIKAVEIRATSGNRSTNIITNYDKIYAASYRELGAPTTDAGYIEEVGTSTSPISWFTNNAQRIKFRGKIRKYDGDPSATIYTCSQEPAALYQTNIAEGTIWIHSGNSYIGYIFLSQSELDQYGITPDIEADSNYASGGWVIAYLWWGRSPGLSNTTYFMYVSYSGGLYGYSAGNVLGVVPCFSI